MTDFSNFPKHVGRVTFSGTPEGLDAFVLAELAAERGFVVHVAQDDSRAELLQQAVRFADPSIRLISLPAWDCLPYDRVSPNLEIVSRRVETLALLAKLDGGKPRKPVLLTTTVNALLQRVPPKEFLQGGALTLKLGSSIAQDKLLKFFENNGYGRSDTVREPGEYAIRGGIVDVFPTGAEEPVRLDFFGDDVDGIRSFDAMSQRTLKKLKQVVFRPLGELRLDDASIQRFRSSYRAHFGAEVASDPVYEAVSAGRKHGGMEHWLPLFHEGMATLFDYIGSSAAWTLDHQIDAALEARVEQIVEYQDARQQFLKASSSDTGGIYRPLPSDALYLTGGEVAARLADCAVGALTPFDQPEDPNVISVNGKAGFDQKELPKDGEVNTFDALATRIAKEQGAGRKVILAGFTEGSRDRLISILGEHGVTSIEPVVELKDALVLDASVAAAAILPVEKGFSDDRLVVISEADVFGERLARPSSRRKRRGEDFLRDVATLDVGDYVVHSEHGIGQFNGLITLEIGSAPHDCLQLSYLGDDKLFIPVENIEVLSRYGSEDATVQLDKLGGSGWQARKARVKKRLLDMAEELIAIAAEREVRRTERLIPPAGTYDEFCGRFPYTETDDQIRAINEVLEDLASGRPMDRLVCGDVGFGKTEVALRAALVAAANGYQVAVVVPTTLLSRQHYGVFKERFRGLGLRIDQLSRMVTTKEANDTKAGLANGDVNIVVGTHSVLAKSANFNNLGLLIVDEEQHFGVGQKERLKDLRKDIHVLTLTATPIPRTLQMSLSGLREMSLIATPPVDRLAVRTFVMPYDGVVIREAIQRERYRGGQVFYVCPRVQDLARVQERLMTLLPDARIGIAHGQMPPSELERIMTRFIDGGFDILLSTNIVESGLDIPTANTIVLHRADMFGLAQLYQLRGRVGRSKTRAYAYLTSHPTKVLTPTAKRRLEVMQTLDSLGAGFSLASHDMDIRGAGNLLGEEQSGQVKEVGIELYQELLREAVEAARSGDGTLGEDTGWSPSISLGMPVLIPESYVVDLPVRMSLYRRIATLEDQDEIEGFGAELADRFGKLPAEVENLMKVIALKQLCKAAGVAKLDAGPKGATVSFHNDSFPNPAGLVSFIQQQAGSAQLRPDHKLVYRRPWSKPASRIAGVTQLMRALRQAAI